MYSNSKFITFLMVVGVFGLVVATGIILYGAATNPVPRAGEPGYCDRSPWAREDVRCMGHFTNPNR